MMAMKQLLTCRRLFQRIDPPWLSLFTVLVVLYIAISDGITAQETTAMAPPTPAAVPAQSSGAFPFEPKSEQKSGNVTALNPATGAITFNGYSWNIGDVGVFDMRYERFLMENQSMIKDEESYYNRLQSIISLLTGNPFGRVWYKQTPNRADFEMAFKNLKEIEANSGWRRMDGGASGQLVTQLEAIVVKLRESGDAKGIAAFYEQKRRDLESKIQCCVGHPDQDLRKENYLAEQKRLAEERMKYLAEASPSLAMAKAQFQIFLFSLLTQRRFQHVIVAAKLYQSVISDGDLGMSQKNNPVAKLAQIDPDLPLTTSVAADLASSAQEEARRNVEAYLNLTNAGMLDAADRTLYQAFIFGEYMPEMRGISIDSRKQVLALRQTRKQMMSALNVRDYGQAEIKLNALTSLAPDFEASAQRMQIRTAKMQSDAYLLKAKNALFNGDQAAAETSLREGASIWPTNPRLDDRKRIEEIFDEQTKLKQDLDDLLAHSDFRLIAERGEKFAAAVHDDAARQAKLREALQHLAEIERGLAKFEELGKAGNHFAAWEVIEEAALKYPKDTKVAIAYQEATLKASDYIGGVRLARENEKQGNQVAALSWYLVVLSKNPTSEKVKLAVKNLSSSLVHDEAKSRAGGAL